MGLVLVQQLAHVAQAPLYVVEHEQGQRQLGARAREQVANQGPECPYFFSQLGFYYFPMRGTKALVCQAGATGRNDQAGYVGYLLQQVLLTRAEGPGLIAQHAQGAEAVCSATP